MAKRLNAHTPHLRDFDMLARPEAHNCNLHILEAKALGQTKQYISVLLAICNEGLEA